MNLFNFLDTTECKNVFGTEVISPIDSTIHYVYLGIQVVVPILLIVFGMIELGKAIAAQKEDEIKKAQSGFLKKLVLAVLVFLVFAIVNFVVNFAAGNDDENEDNKNNIWNCVDDLIN